MIKIFFFTTSNNATYVYHNLLHIYIYIYIYNTQPEITIPPPFVGSYFQEIDQKPIQFITEFKKSKIEIPFGGGLKWGYPQNLPFE